MKAPMQSGFEVAVCVELPHFDDGSIDYDGQVFRRFDFASRAEAVSAAKRLLPKDAWHSIGVTPFEREQFEPGIPVWHKVYGETFYVE